MSKRKRESCSPNSSTSASSNHYQKLNLFSAPAYPGRITKSFSTNSIFNHHNNEMDLDVPKSTSVFTMHKQVHPSSSTSSIESSLSLAQPSFTSSVESLSSSITSLPNEMSTPNNSFKFVKPLQTAFNSSGIVSKKTKSLTLQSPIVFNQNGILIEKKKSASLSFPDTPCKSVNSTNSFDDSMIKNSSFQSKKTARQLLSEFKAGRSNNKDNVPVIKFDSNFKIENTNKNKRNISIQTSLKTKWSPLSMNNQSPLSKEMFDDENNEFFSPVVANFRNKQLKQKQNASKSNNTKISMVPLNLGNKKELRLELPIDAKINTSGTTNINNNGNNTNGTNKFSLLQTPTTPIFTDLDLLNNTNLFLKKSFNNKIKLLGKGEFSKVYQVEFDSEFYAIKQLVTTNKNLIYTNFSRKNSKKKFLNTFLNNHEISKHLGILSSEKRSINDEVEILNHIKISKRSDSNNSKYIIDYIDFFQFDNCGYIITEFYERGTLDQFLLSHGINNRIDEFRIWKILLELSKGLNFLHSNNILHLDLKPVNIFIADDGSLKIGDFGLSAFFNTRSLDRRLDKEGDREYIAPEILSKGKYGYPSDIFSLGLILVEIAANIYLPDNGISWQKLRNGDLSDAGNLSTLIETCSNKNDFINDGKSLDLLVHWMIEPNPDKRPTIDELLNLYEINYINYCHKQPSTIYESEFDKSIKNSSTNDHNDNFFEKSIYR